jgi:hypothetical protein
MKAVRLSTPTLNLAVALFVAVGIGLVLRLELEAVICNIGKNKISFLRSLLKDTCEDSLAHLEVLRTSN